MNLESIFNPLSLMALLPLILLFVLILLYLIGGQGGRSRGAYLEGGRWSRAPAPRRTYR